MDLLEIAVDIATPLDVIQKSPKKTGLQWGHERLGVADGETVGDISKGLRSSKAKTILKGSAKIAGGLALGAGTVALFAAGGALAGAAGLVVGIASLITTGVSVGQMRDDLKDVNSVIEKTDTLAASAAQRLNSAESPQNFSGLSDGPLVQL